MMLSDLHIPCVKRKHECDQFFYFKCAVALPERNFHFHFIFHMGDAGFSAAVLLQTYVTAATHMRWGNIGPNDYIYNSNLLQLVPHLYFIMQHATNVRFFYINSDGGHKHSTITFGGQNILNERVGNNVKDVERKITVKLADHVALALAEFQFFSVQKWRFLKVY